jgi:hypothetical protein
MGDKKGRPKKGQKMNSPQELKKGKKLIPFMVGSYLTYSPSNVTCMQILKFNNNGKSRTRIIFQHNFPLYSRG